ncbi:hypothetical protein BaRGS_00000400 [Batillaria attramentaria]|uniref:Reelin domain-containing protein n=1 Tax=Batillaria attramentaria TaxID=370345 RepID=A0ABD0M9W9_9CAEN
MRSLLLIAAHVALVAAYGTGPPKGDQEGAAKVCMDMFPVGHGEDARTEAPPYEIRLDATQLSLGSPISVKSDQTTYTYFEGVFVQARMASCGSSEGMEALGSFSIAENDTFLQLYSCGKGQMDNAVGHKEASHQSNITFLWHPPASEPGHVYFRATVAKNRTHFWTNVFSPFVTDPSDTRSLPQDDAMNNKYCDVRSTLAGAASSVFALTPLIIAAFVITNALRVFQ